MSSTLLRLCKPGKAIALTLVCFVNIYMSMAGGIRGTIKDDKGEPLPFATIFVKKTGTGTTTNANGFFELALPQGVYEITFQYVGYETAVNELEVGSEYLELHIILKSQATLLQTVVVQAGKEDPAYTIMRKAIAKANYHRNQLDEYRAKVYIKGAGQLKDYPWLAKKQLQKEGIEKGRVFISESVSEIQYNRPNKFSEKVISIRSDGKDNNTSPNQYIFGSFYEPEIAETISPLSPKAFSYYKFEYLGTFRDRDYDISKIKVTPRSKGDNVIEGVINLVENWWSIHSMDIKTSKLGIDITIKAVYAPIEDKAWLPVSHQFGIYGKIFGFEFEYKYLATVSDYRITVNPELYVEPEQMEVVDEKIEKEQARQIEVARADDKNVQLQQRLASGKEITRKELKTLIKDYEKQERKQQKDPEVLFDNTFKIDSGAYKKDSLYWVNIRPVPLTREEIKGYEKSDSMAVVERRKQEGDTLKQSKHKGFQLWDVLVGDSYKISAHSNFIIYTPFGGFNTVEGWNIFYKIGFGTVLQDTARTRLNITPTFRYAFARQKMTGNLLFSVRNRDLRFEAEAGRYVNQLNHDDPIHPIVNTFTTLFLEKNLMKLYERDYVDILFRKRLSPFLTFHTTWSMARRYQLPNHSSYKLVNRRHIEDYTLNEPVNLEVGSTAFPTHEAFIGSVGIQARPWLKFRVRNGRKSEIPNSSPTFLLDYRKGISDVFGSDVDYDQIEAGFRHNFSLGVRARVIVSTRAGVFLNSSNMYFMDFKHFLGNQTPFSTTDPVGSFRLLNYYGFSTADKYFTGNLHYQFRRFLVTSLPKVRLMGIRENVFLNYLATPMSANYTEAGYSIDGILRIFRLEGAAAFRDGKYLDYGFRLGITTNIGVNFND
jgi:hypothetical protein